MWDLRKSNAVESRDILFFEDGLPPPTHRLAMHADDADEPVVRHPVDSPTQFVPRTIAQTPALTPVPPPTTPTVTHREPLPATRGHLRVEIKLSDCTFGKLMVE